MWCWIRQISYGAFQKGHTRLCLLKHLYDDPGDIGVHPPYIDLEESRVLLKETTDRDQDTGQTTKFKLLNSRLLHQKKGRQITSDLALKSWVVLHCSFEIKNRLRGTYIGAVEVFDRKQGQPIRFSWTDCWVSALVCVDASWKGPLERWKSTGMMKGTQSTCKLHFQCYLSFLTYPVLILALSSTLHNCNRHKFKRYSLFLIINFACYAMAVVDFYFASCLVCKSEYYCHTLLQEKNTVISSTHTAVDMWQAGVQQWPSV